ncbi:hypothetical protein ScPMuIL_001965 [Solemya velum]
MASKLDKQKLTALLCLIQEREASDSDSDDDDFQSESESESEYRMMLEMTDVDDEAILLGALCNKDRRTDEGDVNQTNYATMVVPNMDDHSFKCQFRMLPSTYKKVLDMLRPLLQTKHVVLESQLLSAIWLLATPDSYRSVGQQFGFKKGSLHFYFLRVCKALASKFPEVIKWPESCELAKLSSDFECMAGFPGVVGCIDGTYIPIRGPTDNRDAYICRKGYPAIHLQGCCDASMKFTDVSVGNPGSIHDARAFSTSELQTKLNNSPLPSQYHLLGNSAYRLTQYMMVPFRDNGHLTDDEKKFNKFHSSTRVTIERCFGLLKGKFRRLKYLDMLLLPDMSYVLLAACVLHNIIIDNEGQPPAI